MPITSKIQSFDSEIDKGDNRQCSLRRCIKGCSVEIQHEILQHLVRVVRKETLQNLLLCREVRKLWDTPAALDLVDDEESWSFCNAVQAFQVGILATHPRIHFANISILQIRVYDDSNLIDAFKIVLQLLHIEDLGLWCGDTPNFMTRAVRVWAPSLRHLLILRIKFDRDFNENPRIYPWLESSWSSTVSCLPIRTLWVDTPLPLSDDIGRRLSRVDNVRRMSHFELKGYLLDMVSGTWATGNNSLQRVYIFFGYDEDLDLGDGMVCSGYRYRLRKQRSSGCWGIVDISASSASAEISAFLGSLHRRFDPDSLSGILPDDVDHFAENDD